MLKTSRLIRSGFAALAVITAVGATATVLLPQPAMAKGHHERSSRDATKDTTGHETETNSKG